MEECPELQVWPQTRVEWRIKNFRDLSKEVGFYLESPHFFLSDTKWHISMYPNGNDSDSEGYVSLFLHKEKSQKEKYVDFNMEIKKCDGTVLKTVEFEHEFEIRAYGRGRPKFLQRLEVNESAVSPDGTLAIFCSATIKNESLEPSTKGVTPTTTCPPTTMEAISQTYSDDTPNLCKDLKDLYVSKRFTDVTVQVKSREFHAHRNILATRSAVFASMFGHDTMESESGRVEIPDCDPDTFEDFLLFLYTGNLDAVTSSNAFSLYETSEKYDVQALKEECVRCMTNTLTVDSFCDVLQLATKYNESELLKTATDFFINNTKDVLMTTKWHTYIFENPLLGNELFLKTFTKS